MFSLFTFFSLLLLVARTSFASCYLKFIHNVTEFLEFANDVNSGTNYYGYTVYLTGDIDFNTSLSQKFVPIGHYDNGYPTNFFYGTFDGQGYVIRNLKTSSSFRTVGLFGYTSAITVRNVVMDSSCSTTNKGTNWPFGTGPYIGGIVGWCYMGSGPCIIENCVNMGSFTYSGSSSSLYIGGIIGTIDIHYNTYGMVLNCVNYGSIYAAGSISSWVDIGGIIGEMYKTANYGCYIYNCINFGSVTNTGTSYAVGGLDGHTHGITMTNCVSNGRVTNYRANAGGIFGRAANYYTSIYHCYWTSATTRSDIYGTYSNTYGYSGSAKLDTISVGNANWLNSYAVTNKWNEWAYNQNYANVTFVVHDGEGFSYQSQLILLPRADRRGYSFLFWCVNQNSTSCSKKYDRTITSTFTKGTILYAQWVVNNCTVYLDVNGGYELPADVEKTINTTYDQEIGELPDPARRGYTFVGWHTAYGELLTNESLVNNACNCSLYAHWDPNNYTVILDVNRGNSLTNNRLTVTFDSKYGKLPTATRDGFSFSGWFTIDNKNITENTVVNITSTQTLYAHWGPKKYTVTLNVNGGNALPSNKRKATVLADQAYGQLAIPTRRGYTFAGWYTASNGLITNDTATTAIISKDQTLYAHWSPNDYTVSFDVNGGDTLPEEEENKTITFDAAYDSLPEPTRTGYTSDGWFTDKNVHIVNTTKVNFAYDHTLYAKWTPNKYIIEFDANGGDGLTIITVTFNSSYDCLPMPSREGYTFMWWYIKDTGKIVYNKTIVLTACNHVLCAVWNKNTIIFDVNGGNTLPDEDKKMEVTYEGSYKTLPTPTRTGYTFGGWYTDDDVKIESGSTVKVSSDQTLHAKWIPNSYTMPLNPSGGTITDPSVTVIYHDYYGTLPTPSREGYTFTGWVTENGETITITTIVTDPCHCVLSAGWEPDTYIIIFVTNGGDELIENKIEVTYDGMYGILPTPTKRGYTFVGWFDEDGNEIKTGMKVDVANNQTFTAEWIPNDYTVGLNPNGCEPKQKREYNEENNNEDISEGSNESINEDRIIVTFDDTYDSLPTPEKTGYTFDGWFTEDGNDIITNETKVEIADNHSLCAEWTANNYTVIFDVNGGDELDADEKEMEFTYNEIYDYLPTPIRSGYTFVGWFTEDGVEEITPDTEVRITSDQTFYAHWNEVPSSLIEVIFGKKGLSEEEIRKILKIFTDAEFSIDSIEYNEAGETIAIIRFDDILKAEEFIKNLMESSDEMKNFIRVAYSSSKVEESISTIVCPFILFNVLLI